MNNIVDVTVYRFIESKKMKKQMMWQKVKECYELVQVPFAQKDINHAHRIGMEYTKKNPGKKVKFMESAKTILRCQTEKCQRW